LTGESAEAALVTVAGLEELWIGKSKLGLGRISKGKV